MAGFELGSLLGNDAEGGDGDRCRAKNDELDDAAAINQVDGELHQDAGSIGCSRSSGEFGVILNANEKAWCAAAPNSPSPKNAMQPRISRASGVVGN